MNKFCLATTLHSIMSREKDDGGNVETNLHGEEMDNVELDPEKERSLHRGLRKVNTKDRESVEAEI